MSGLVIFGNPKRKKNPAPYNRSEFDAWRHILADAKALENRTADAKAPARMVKIAEQMMAQLDRGVHRNPGGKRTKIGEHVQAVLYIHAKDGHPYCHGFGDADIGLKTIRNGDVRISGLHEDTDVTMYGESDGTITMEGRNGQPLWKMHDV